MASQFYGDSIFWIEVDKVKPNPYQPRHEFDEVRLRDLADSIRMYGVLQPLVVTRKEVTTADGGLATEYELISGERRLRASKLAGVSQVPVIIRNSTDDARVKLELAIIENLQREDLNPVDRARSFERLVSEFNLKHAQIAEKIGKSREYVSNCLRLLTLPQDMLDALSQGKMSEGHARPIMMLVGRPEEQQTLFKEVIYKRLTVREAESIARRIAYDKVRKREYIVDPEISEMEEKFTEQLGTRVHIEKKEKGGKIHIDFFSPADLQTILAMIKPEKTPARNEMMERFITEKNVVQETVPESAEPTNTSEIVETVSEIPTAPIDDRSTEEKKEDEDELYSLKNFSI